MNGKRKVSRMATAIGVILTATCGLALAQGWHHGGGGKGDGQLFLLARAAGVSKTTLASTFHGNTTLHNDFSTLRSSHQAVISCLVATPSNCTNAITAYETAQTQLTKDKFAAWQGVFAAAPSLSNASTVLGQLQGLKTQEQALRQQKHQILQGVFGTQSSSESPEASTTPME